MGSFVAQKGRTGGEETNFPLGSQVITKGPSHCLEGRGAWVEEEFIDVEDK